MSFTVEDFHDLVRILEEKPEWGAALRSHVLTRELLSVPEQIAGLRAETERRFQELIGQVATLTGQVAELVEVQKRMAREMTEISATVRVLKDDMGELKGDALENRYRTRVYAYFGRFLRRAHTLSPDELTALLEPAVDTDVLSEAEANEVALADLVVQGRRKDDGTQVYAVVAVSWGVGTDDVSRAVRRAALLARIGTATIPIVAGNRVTDEAKWLAQKEQVWQLTDGRAVPPEPSQAGGAD